MNLTEATGLILAVAGAALVPLGWIVSAKIVVVGFVLLGVGVGLFYTERRLRREEKIDKESTGGGGTGSGVPADFYNYTGWRSGGRRRDMESTFESGDADGD